MVESIACGLFIALILIGALFISALSNLDD